MSHTSSGHGADDHGGLSQPSAEALKLGYEPDGYHTATVISVPVLVIVFFVLAFTATTLLFGYFTRNANKGVETHPLAVDRNKADLNDRLRRIGNGSEVDQPRLEPLRTRSGNARAITRPEDNDGSNPPYMHPEDNRADATRTPELFRLAWEGKDKKVAVVPLSDVMTAKLPKLFPVQAHGTKPPSSEHLPTASNSGRGAEHAEAVMPKLPSGPQAPVPPEKKPEEKKSPEGKK